MGVCIHHNALGGLRGLCGTEVELLCHKLWYTVELVNRTPHVNVTHGDAFAIEFLGHLHELALFIVPHTLQEAEAREPTDDKTHILLGVRPIGHAGQVQLIGGGGESRGLAVGVGSVGVCRKVHGGLRVRGIGPMVAIFGRERGTGGGTKFVAEVLLFANRFSLLHQGFHFGR